MGGLTSSRHSTRFIIGVGINMSKINEFRTELYLRLPDAAKKYVLVFEGGPLTSREKPWFRTFLTDSDAGMVGIFMISDQCYDSRWRETILLAIERSVVSQRIISLNEISGNTFSDQMEKVAAVPIKTRKKRGRPKVEKTPVAPPKRKRGRPKKN